MPLVIASSTFHQQLHLSHYPTQQRFLFIENNDLKWLFLAATSWSWLQAPVLNEIQSLQHTCGTLNYSNCQNFLIIYTADSCCGYSKNSKPPYSKQQEGAMINLPEGLLFTESLLHGFSKIDNFQGTTKSQRRRAGQSVGSDSWCQALLKSLFPFTTQVAVLMLKSWR